MTSTIKVDTISENTNANGVAVDSLAIKDGKITNLMNATLSAADLGTGIHIKTADSGATANSNHSEIVIEGSGHSGMSILSGTGSNGVVCFGDSGNNCIGYLKYDHSDNALVFGGNTAERMRIDSSGKVGIAETNPQAKLSIGGHMSITATSRLYFDGAGDTFISEASANVMAFTTGNSERMRISSDGLHIGGTGSANALDDYEEGTCTLAMSDNNTSFTMASGFATGHYTKIGNRVYVNGYIKTTSINSASSNDVKVTGLPFTSNSTNNSYASVNVGYQSNLNISAGTPIGGFVNINSTQWLVTTGDTGGGTTNMPASEWSNDGEIVFSLNYITA